MKIIPSDVTRVVITRVVVAWAGLSIVAGTATAYFEVMRVNRIVLGMAANEAKPFLAHIDAIGPEHLDELESQAGKFLQGNFVGLRLYDRDGKKLLESFQRGRTGPHLTLPQHVHDVSSEKIDSHMHWIDGNLLMQILLAVTAGDGRRLGFFEGVYQVDAETLENITGGIAASLALTLATVLTTGMVLYSVIATLNVRLIHLSADLLQGNLELMETLGSAIALRDSSTDAHNYRVTAYSLAMGKALQLPPQQFRDLIAGALLHDAGKIGVNDAILYKPGPLSPVEMESMRHHVSLGAGIVARSSWLRGARDVVEFHHERYDGSGYLKGLAADAIPLNARVFAIIDVFDALTSRRAYKEPLPFEQAMTILQRGRGTHFDPWLLDIFASIAAEMFTRIGSLDELTLHHTVRSQVDEHFRLADDIAWPRFACRNPRFAETT